MTGRMVQPQELQIEGLEVPRLFYLVFKEPAPLAGMAYPGPHVPWRRLYELGFRHVVCLCSGKVEYDISPLKLLYAVEMEDLHHGNEPLYPARNETLARNAVAVINEKLDKKEGVAVHCIGGTGRTGTVIGCVLRSRGYAADDIIAYLDEVNKRRGRRGWPESPWQAGMIRHF